MNLTRHLLLFFLIAPILAGCSVKKMTVRSTAGLMDQGIEAVFEEKDPEFAEQSLVSQLKLLEILHKNEPENLKVLNYLAQGFGAYGFLFIEPKDAERAKIFYERGRDYGLLALRLQTGFDFASESDLSKVDAALNKISKSQVASLFWTAYSWGGLANLSLNDPQTLAQLPKIEKMMLRVREIVPGYFYGGPEIFLGAYYGARPKMFGGDLAKSKDYFQKAMAFSKSKFLMTQVLFAKYYSINAMDEASFRDALGSVTDFKLDDFKEQYLSNVVAQRRARKLLEEINEHF